MLVEIHPHGYALRNLLWYMVHPRCESWSLWFCFISNQSTRSATAGLILIIHVSCSQGNGLCDVDLMRQSYGQHFRRHGRLTSIKCHVSFEAYWWDTTVSLRASRAWPLGRCSHHRISVLLHSPSQLVWYETFYRNAQRRTHNHIQLGAKHPDKISSTNGLYCTLYFEPLWAEQKSCYRINILILR